jgi:hypothetical protein
MAIWDRIRTVVIAVAVCSPWAATAGQSVGPDKKILVGVNYFAGWWEELPNKWHGHGWAAGEPDWRPKYSNRVPLLGAYNDQATMDREIVVAADHNVDFFSILWYFAAPGNKEEADCKRLNRGLENFLRSPHADRLRFIVEYCNHAHLAATSDVQWERCIAAWVAALRHPSCLRVGGRLVFKVHDAAGFWRQNDQDITRCRARLDALRRAVRAAGLGEMLIGGGVMSRSQVAAGAPLTKLFDFTATYMSIPPVDVRDEEYPYARLAEEARNARPAHAADPIPWVPYLAVGWNPRPWTHPQADPNHRRFFRFPTQAEWTAELRAVGADLDKYPGLGLPLPHNQRQRVFTIYAWNEFGEGGFLAPTQGDGFMKLQAIREVFAGGE